MLQSELGRPCRQPWCGFPSSQLTISKKDSAQATEGAAVTVPSVRSSEHALHLSFCASVASVLGRTQGARRFPGAQRSASIPK